MSVPLATTYSILLLAVVLLSPVSHIVATLQYGNYACIATVATGLEQIIMPAGGPGPAVCRGSVGGFFIADNEHRPIGMVEAQNLALATVAICLIRLVDRVTAVLSALASQKAFAR